MEPDDPSNDVVEKQSGRADLSDDQVPVGERALRKLVLPDQLLSRSWIAAFFAAIGYALGRFTANSFYKQFGVSAESIGLTQIDYAVFAILFTATFGGGAVIAFRASVRRTRGRDAASIGNFALWGTVLLLASGFLIVSHVGASLLVVGLLGAILGLLVASVVSWHRRPPTLDLRARMRLATPDLTKAAMFLERSKSSSVLVRSYRRWRGRRAIRTARASLTSYFSLEGYSSTRS